jgi:hypothetical protein
VSVSSCRRASYERHARWRREIRQVALAERDLQIAALGDFDRVLERFGKVGKQLDHFSGRLEVLLLGVQARTAGIAEHVALGNAHPRFVRLEVVAFEKLDRMRGHQRQLEFGRQIGGGGDQHILLRLPITLHFEVEGTGNSASQRRARLAACSWLPCSSASPTSPAAAPESAISPSTPTSCSIRRLISARPRTRGAR